MINMTVGTFITKINLSCHPHILRTISSHMTITKTINELFYDTTILSDGDYEDIKSITISNAERMVP